MVFQYTRIEEKKSSNIHINDLTEFNNYNDVIRINLEVVMVTVIHNTVVSAVCLY